MSLTTRLKREIKASPAKAGGLAVLLAVAAYFWLPLAWDKFAPDKVAPPPASAGATPAATSKPTASNAPQSTPQQEAADAIDYDWRTYAQLIEGDGQMHSTSELRKEHDPFSRPAPPAPTAAEPQAPPVVVEPLTPAEAGLVLSSTLLGAQLKIAEIGGKSYTIGDLVDVEQDQHSTLFQVVEIHPRRVVLKSDDKLYELTIPRPLVDAAAESRTADRDPAGVGPGAEARQTQTSDSSGEGDATSESAH